ncbi:MAG TPA: cellulase family glycosylhydrolase [Bacillota bacterium]|nr:cellulase family glycosylhydrolase [Bacillota bacterium]
MKLTKKLIFLVVCTCIVLSLSFAASASYLHTSGNQILDASGNKASLSGLSWFGFETNNYSPHGLWAHSMNFYLDIVKNNGFNHLRVPYCSQMFDSGSMPTSIDSVSNPDLVGMTPIQVMDTLVQRCKDRGLRIYLDRHRPDGGGQSALWYTSAYDETRWINDWKMLASRYKGNDTVMGCDLHNEPHSPANWGSGSTTNDWRLAAERCGNAILGVNPDLLIIVEGVDSYNGNGYWWGGNLMGAKDYPVRLNVANRLVYSAHDYGPGVASQTWFSDSTFPNNMPGVWDKYWGYLHKNATAPVLVGEFGGRSTDTSSVEGKWQNGLVNYIKSNGIHWTYWCLNPNSGDTGGFLSDDWGTVVQAKLSMLKPAMYPMIPGGGGNNTPTPTRAVTPTPTARQATATPTGRPATATPTQRAGTPTPTMRTATPTPTNRTISGGYAVSYTIQSDWGNGATVSVTIINNTTAALNGWTLAFTFPGNQAITNLWSGTYTQSGASVSVKDGGFNANIPASGGTVNFGFNLNYSGSNAKPTSFTLNGTACQVQ